MKNKIYNILTVSIILVVGLLSCDNDEVFKAEQYKNVFALISKTDNIYSKYYDLRESESIGYLSASCGGTNPTTEDINILLVEDPTLIDLYNKTNYDVEYNKYANQLPKSKYDIDSYQLKIPAGKIKASLPIRIRPEGLSPDSTYYIPLRIDSHDNYEANPDKSYVLFEVRIKNYFAKAEGATYNLKGKEDGRNIFGTKIIHPLTGSKVRIMAGTEAYIANTEVHEQYALILDVNEEGKVHITPYGKIQVSQVDGDSDYPNTFDVTFDGYKHYKTFLLRYDYTINNKTYQMKEELRLQFNPKNKEEL